MKTHCGLEVGWAVSGWVLNFMLSFLIVLNHPVCHDEAHFID